ncbi:hypothetical protein ACFFRR_005927, partial [Megaselia abdita]
MRFIFYSVSILISQVIFSQCLDFSFPVEEETGHYCKGKCVLGLECEVALNIVKYAGFRPKTCFFKGKYHYICCPIKGMNGTIEGTFLGQRLSDKKCDEYYPYMKYEIHPIIGGVSAIPYDFKFMSAIGWNNTQGASRFGCGGSLISQRHILTAAHCTIQDGLQPDFVRLWATNLSKADGFDVSIKSVVTHPNYDPNHVYDDIAILELESDVKVRPACLWQTPEPPFKEITALGYGHMEFAGVISNTLQRVQLDLFKNSECSPFYEKTDKIPSGLTKQQICAGDASEKKDTCQGDSGGPILVKLQREQSLVPHVIAITSFGGTCAGGSPGLYVRI